MPAWTAVRALVQRLFRRHQPPALCARQAGTGTGMPQLRAATGEANPFHQRKSVCGVRASASRESAGRCFSQIAASG